MRVPQPLHPTVLRRRARAALLVALAAAPGATLLGGSGPAAGALHLATAASGSTATATAAATPPQVAYAVGSSAMQAAQAIARAQWGFDPCGGQVAISWTQLDPQVNALSTWSNPTSSYDNPSQNSDCSIQFNSAAPFDWPMFCTVLVHEYGHLTGHPHSSNPDDVMAPIYSKPLAACGSDPSGAPAQPAPTTTPSVAATAVHHGARRTSVARRAVLRRLQRAAHVRAQRARAARARAARARRARTARRAH